MSKTVRLELPLLYTQQRQKELTVNESLCLLDSLVNGKLIGFNCSKPPLNHEPKNGDVYHILNPQYFAWMNYEQHLAIYYEGWNFVQPKNGMVFWVESEQMHYYFNENKWWPMSLGQVNSNVKNNILTIDKYKQEIEVSHNSINLININVSTEITIKTNSNLAKFTLIIDSNGKNFSFSQKIISTSNIKDNLQSSYNKSSLSIYECIFQDNNLLVTSFFKMPK